VKYSRFHRAGKEPKKGFSGGAPPPSRPRSAGEGSLQASPGDGESACGLLHVMRMGDVENCPHLSSRRGHGTLTANRLLRSDHMAQGHMSRGVYIVWRNLWLAVWALLGWVLVSCANRPAQVVIEWSTETEVNTIGFNLYRAESPEGPFTRVNDQLIPSSPDPLVGGHYVYTDTQVAAGRTYYYELEDVEANGISTRHGPIAVTVQPALPTWVWGLIGASMTLIGILGWRGLRRLSALHG
jgi:hypothetical protein